MDVHRAALIVAQSIIVGYALQHASAERFPNNIAAIVAGDVGARLAAAPDLDLEQVIENLVANAIRHTPAGGCIESQAAAEPGGVRLSVVDPGAGIAPEHVPHVFNRFYKVDTSRAAASGRQRVNYNSDVDNALDVRRLSIRFGESQILKDLSFTVPRGTSLAILGPNGAGKTVLFRALIGAIPYEGDIRWAGGTRIGYVPQKLDLERDVPITGRDFLRARSALARTSNANITRALGLVGVPPELAEHPIGTLSGGQFQRLLVAFALVGDPNVLLLDEPTAGVDEPGQEQLNELVHRLQHEQALTVLFISHELTVVYRYATNVLCLSRAQACIGPPRAILTPDLLHEMYGTPMDHHVHDR